MSWYLKTDLLFFFPSPTTIWNQKGGNGGGRIDRWTNLAPDLKPEKLQLLPIYVKRKQLICAIQRENRQRRLKSEKIDISASRGRRHKPVRAWCATCSGEKTDSSDQICVRQKKPDLISLSFAHRNVWGEEELCARRRQPDLSGEGTEPICAVPVEPSQVSRVRAVF